MKKYLIIHYIFCCIASGICDTASGNIHCLNSTLIKHDLFKSETGTLTGFITDKGSGQPLTGVTVYISELKTGAVSGIDGSYKIENLPLKKVNVKISFIGFKLILAQVDLSLVNNKNFEMEESIAELHEVVVTGLSREAEKNRTPTPVSIITTIQLLQSSSTNIIDVIASQPGISQVTTGQSISKPVIRGLGFNRLVVVNDGIRQEGQQWGDEHGIEIDEYSVNKVEILKGPASLAYGSDAMAGVINFITAPTLPNGIIKGSVISNYQTNNGLVGFSANIAGNYKRFIWDLRISNKNAHAYQNKYDGYVFNSAFSEQNYSGSIGINRSWGYTRVHFSNYYLKAGIVEGDRSESTGEFLKSVALNDSVSDFVIASRKDLKSYSLFNPYQKVFHTKVVVENKIIAGDGNINLLLGWQQNRRQEFGDIFNPNSYGLYFKLNTLNYDMNYNYTNSNSFSLSAGINGMYQNSSNEGIEYLVPEYALFDAGIYLIGKKNYDKIDISGGIRFDNRTEKGENLFLDENGLATENTAVEQRFFEFNSDFSGISGSLGIAYQFSEMFYSKFNLSRGFRAPNISELGSNGEHEGTSRYEIGNPDLKPESSLQADFALGFNSHHVTAELNLFANRIENYIYTQKLVNELGNDSLIDDITVYDFTSGDALLAGGEFTVDIHPHPLDWLHIENSFSYVNGRLLNQDQLTYLPLIPAPEINSEIKAVSKKLSRNLANSFLKVGVEYNFKQDNFYGFNDTETATSDYTLINFGLGTDVMIKGILRFSGFISINNIADTGWQSHLSRLKYAAVNNVTGRRGVYNMGRNVSFKIIIPFTLKK